MDYEHIAYDLEHMTLDKVMQKYNLTKNQVYYRYRKARGQTAKLGVARSSVYRSKADRNTEIREQRRKGVTLEEIGRRYNISRQRVKQICQMQTIS